MNNSNACANNLAQTNQTAECAVDIARKITECGYNLDCFAGFITFHDDPKSIARRISNASFDFIELLTSVEHADTTRFNASFFVLQELFEVFDQMEVEANTGTIVVVPKANVQQQHDELQAAKYAEALEEIKGLKIRYDAVWRMHEDDEVNIEYLNKMIADKNTAIALQDDIIQELRSAITAPKPQLQNVN